MCFCGGKGTHGKADKANGISPHFKPVTEFSSSSTRIKTKHKTGPGLLTVPALSRPSSHLQLLAWASSPLIPLDLRTCYSYSACLNHASILPFCLLTHGLLQEISPHSFPPSPQSLVLHMPTRGRTSLAITFGIVMACLTAQVSHKVNVGSNCLSPGRLGLLEPTRVLSPGPSSTVCRPTCRSSSIRALSAVPSPIITSTVTCV